MDVVSRIQAVSFWKGGKRFPMRTLGVVAISAMLLALGLAPGAVAVDLGGGIGNVVPVITSVTASGSYDPTSGATTSVPVSTVITDTNGCSDLTTGSAAVTG